MASRKQIEERRNRICELLRTHRTLGVGYLSSLLRASRLTIRRDLQQLASQNMVARIHGGVALVGGDSDEPPYMLRSREMRREKEAIGKAAADLVGEREVILVDIGSTLLSLARHLPTEKGITVVTNWIPLILELKRGGPFRVFCLGGNVTSGELSLTGGYTDEMLRNFNADKLFLGVAGISPTAGLTDFDMEEIRIKRQMIRCAREVIILADHSKFGRVAPLRTAPLEAVHRVVTDTGVRDEDRRRLEDLGVAVTVASALPSASAPEKPRPAPGGGAARGGGGGAGRRGFAAPVSREE